MGTSKQGLLLAVVALFSACSFEDPTSSGISSPQSKDSTNPYCLIPSPWTPQVTGAGESNHDPALTVHVQNQTALGRLFGLAQGYGASDQIEFSINVSTDLGIRGSITLEGKTVSFPPELSGSAFPVLVSFKDPSGVEYVNLTPQCASEGFFTCTGGTCDDNPNCTVGSVSAFLDRRMWRQSQIPAFGDVSTNRFPSCNHTTGSPACDFNTTFFTNGKLPTGTYIAKYILAASNYANLSFAQANMELKATLKTDTVSASGALDLNVIFVGSANIQDSLTPRGQMNLNALFQHVHNYFNANGIKLGKIQGFQWSCDDAQGDGFANVDLNDLESLFELGSEITPAQSHGKSLNLFLVSTIPSAALSGTVLGAAGAIGGPTQVGSGSSGIVISTFENLDSFNPLCMPPGPCVVAQQEREFWETGATVTHEMGHYLGLNHPTESDGDTNDTLPITPTCGNVTSDSPSHSVCRSTSKSGSDASACLSQCPTYLPGSQLFCPTAVACQYNHAMYWTTKNFSQGLGDGNLFSTDASPILHHSVFSQ